MPEGSKQTITFGHHAPGYHRYCGYFCKMLLCDVFISQDTIQYAKTEWQNRQRFYHAGRETWLTVPVNKSIEPIMLKQVVDPRTVKAHWRYIRETYGKTPFFKEYSEPLAEIYSRRWTHLNDLCDALTLYAKSVLGIDTQYLRDSENNWVDRGLKKGGLIADSIHRAISVADYEEVIYLAYARPMREGYYIDEILDDSGLTEGEKIERAGITVSSYSFQHPVYRQHQLGSDEPFVPNLGIFDLIFNCGEASREVLESAGREDHAST